ncbi:hypothetical protein CIK05_07370 [Bdellovibrio sp. qaytius]|nr:hypothetical protein CIK05_07370 [Bdellovibrio sp. qaytius]
MMIKALFSFLVIFSFAYEVSAEEAKTTTQEKVEAVKDAVKDTVHEAQKALSHSRQIRQTSKYFGTLNFAPVDLILPSKFGLTAGYVETPDQTWEFEYLKSSVSVPFVVDDLGSMTDERFSIIKRDYFGTETFNLNYGLSYYRFKVHVGNKYLASVSSNAPDVDLMQIDSLGFNVGIGNRWIFSNRWIVGMDWASWSQPVVTTRYNDKYADLTNNPDDKDKAKKFLKLISWVPRITLLKLQIGYSF